MPLMMIFVSVPIAVSMIVLLDLFGGAIIDVKNRGFTIHAEFRM